MKKYLALFLLPLLSSLSYARELAYLCVPHNKQQTVGIDGEENLVLRFNGEIMSVYLPAHNKEMYGAYDPTYRPTTHIGFARYNRFDEWLFQRVYRVEVLINEYMQKGSEWGIARLNFVGRGKYFSHQLKCFAQ